MLKNKYDKLGAARSTLTEKIAQLSGSMDNDAPSISALSIRRSVTRTEPASCMLGPCVCLIAQGAKRVLLGEEAYVYDAHHFLITSVDLPVVAQIIEASEKKPYLGLVLELDLREVAQLMVDSSLPLPRVKHARRGMAVSEVSLQLLDAFLRLINLLDEPEDIPIMAPLIKREILYRLLVGDQGMRLRQIAAAGSQSFQIARAIEWLKNNFAQPLRINDLADYSRMSVSSFHHHFRSLTAMSPLQYQKWLRLHEARRIMLMERLDAATAAYRVGYESPSQFSREYNRLFGQPPLRDIASLRKMTIEAGV